MKILRFRVFQQSLRAAALALAAGITAVSANDVIHLKSGDPVHCEIEALTDNIVSFALRSSAGTAGGTARRTIPAEQVDYVAFGFEPGEEAVFRRLDEADAATLDEWWGFHFGDLHRPRSRTASYGVALGGALIEEESESARRRGLELFDRVIERAWSAKDVAAAKQGRLRALIALGDLETATKEAAALAAETEDPDLLIEVKHLRARAGFARLKALEEEHPRWDEDDEVRPERNALYHRTVDRFLWPHLFHATREDAAARGLMAAADVFLFADRPDRARECFEDLARLYPGTAVADEAEERFRQLPSANPTETENP
ncbi:MAG: hypothetical protein WD342_16290 [Verrucomicrobiales bacterium]